MPQLADLGAVCVWFSAMVKQYFFGFWGVIVCNCNVGFGHYIVFLGVLLAIGWFGAPIWTLGYTATYFFLSHSLCVSSILEVSWIFRMLPKFSICTQQSTMLDHTELPVDPHHGLQSPGSGGCSSFLRRSAKHQALCKYLARHSAKNIVLRSVQIKYTDNNSYQTLMMKSDGTCKKPWVRLNAELHVIMANLQLTNGTWSIRCEMSHGQVLHSLAVLHLPCPPVIQVKVCIFWSFYQLY